MKNIRSIIRHGCGTSGTESLSLLTDPATYDILNSELTNCPRTAFVLGELATQWQQMMVSLLLDIAEPGQRNWEHAQDTDRCDGKSTATKGRRGDSIRCNQVPSLVHCIDRSQPCTISRANPASDVLPTAGTLRASEMTSMLNWTLSWQ